MHDRILELQIEQIRRFNKLAADLSVLAARACEMQAESQKRLAEIFVMIGADTVKMDERLAKLRQGVRRTGEGEVSDA